jgi:hypothetical protein
MSYAHLTVYLRDHRAGALAAVALLEQLEETHAGSPLARFAEQLRTEVTADVRELDALMERMGIGAGLVRNAGGWLAQKVAEVKVRLDDSGDGALRLLETLEALALGIDGKRALWGALSAAAERTPSLAHLDYARLRQRADIQRGWVEQQRVAAARDALDDGKAPARA